MSTFALTLTASSLGASPSSESNHHRYRHRRLGVVTGPPHSRSPKRGSLFQRNSALPEQFKETEEAGDDDAISWTSAMSERNVADPSRASRVETICACSATLTAGA